MKSGRKTKAQLAVSRLDYGPDAGAGLEHADEGRVKGRAVAACIDPELNAAGLLAMRHKIAVMPFGADLLRHDGKKSWGRELLKWVRRCEEDNVDIPEGIVVKRKKG